MQKKWHEEPCLAVKQSGDQKDQQSFQIRDSRKVRIVDTLEKKYVLHLPW